MPVLPMAVSHPALLYPVDEILLVGIVSVVNDEGPEALGGLLLEPVLEDEAEDAARHLDQQQDRQADGILGTDRQDTTTCVRLTRAARADALHP